MAHALAIDLGTTAAKAAVVDTTGHILGSGMQQVSTVFGADGRAEQDAEAVWRAVLAACAEALRTAGEAAARQVRVVCATSQWASIVPVDVHGMPVAAMVTWLDQRGEAETDALLSGPHGGEQFVRWPEVHGLIPAASLGHVLAVQHRRPDVHARTAAYLEPMDYLAARFTGRIAANANTVMPFALTDNRDLATVHWSDELITRAGVDRSRLPELVPSCSVLGPLRADVAADLGLPGDAVMATGANDSIAAALGTGAIGNGCATVVVGTTGVLTAHHPTRVVDVEHFVLTMPGALTDRYYVVAEAGLAGKVVETALVQWELARGHDELAALAASSPAGANGVIALPWINGSLAPAPNFALRGGLLGLSLTTTRADLARAVLEGVALQMRWLLDETEAALGTRFDTLRLAGGGAQSDVWAAIVSDVLGRPLDQVEQPRLANSRGAAVLGFLAIGALTLADVIGSTVPVRRHLEPDPIPAALYTERLALLRDLHGALTMPSLRLRGTT